MSDVVGLSCEKSQVSLIQPISMLLTTIDSMISLILLLRPEEGGGGVNVILSVFTYVIELLKTNK